MLNHKVLVILLSYITLSVSILSYKYSPNKQWSSRIVGDKCMTAKNKYILVQHCQQELSIQLIHNPKTNNSLMTEATNSQLNISQYWKFDAQEKANMLSVSVNENKIYIMRDCTKMMVYLFDLNLEKIYLSTNITFQTNYCGDIQSTPLGVIVSDNSTVTSNHYFIKQNLFLDANQAQITLDQNNLELIENLKNITSIGTASEDNQLIISSNCSLYKTTLEFQVIDQYNLRAICKCDQSIRIDSQNQQGTLFSLGCFNPSSTSEWRYLLLNELDQNQDNWLYLVSTYSNQKIIESTTAVTTYKDSTFFFSVQPYNNINIDLFFEGVKGQEFYKSYYNYLTYQKNTIQEEAIDFLFNENLSQLIVTFNKNDTVTIPFCKFKYQRFQSSTFSCELCNEGTFSFGFQRGTCQTCSKSYIYVSYNRLKLSETTFCIKPDCQYSNKLGYSTTYNETFFLNDDGVCESSCSGPQMLRTNKKCSYKCDYNCIECQTMNHICRYTSSQCQFNSNSAGFSNLFDNSKYLSCPNIQANYSYSPIKSESFCNIIESNNLSSITLPKYYSVILEHTVLCRREYQILNISNITINSLITSERLSKESLTIYLDQPYRVTQINQKIQSVGVNPSIKTNLTILYSVEPNGFIGGFNISLLYQTPTNTTTQINTQQNQTQSQNITNTTTQPNLSNTSSNNVNLTQQQNNTNITQQQNNTKQNKTQNTTTNQTQNATNQTQQIINQTQNQTQQQNNSNIINQQNITIQQPEQENSVCYKQTKCLDCVLNEESDCQWDLNRKSCQGLDNNQSKDTYYISLMNYQDCPIKCNQVNNVENDNNFLLYFNVNLQQNAGSTKCLLYQYNVNFEQEQRILLKLQQPTKENRLLQEKQSEGQQLMNSDKQNKHNRMLQSSNEYIILTLQNKNYLISSSEVELIIPSGPQQLLFSYQTSMNQNQNISRRLLVVKNFQKAPVIYLQNNNNNNQKNYQIYIIIGVSCLGCCLLFISLWKIINFKKRQIPVDEDLFRDISLEPVKIPKLEDEDCPICLDSLRTDQYLYFPCKRHLIHLNCLKHWVTQRGNQGPNKYCIYRCEIISNQEENQGLLNSN